MYKIFSTYDRHLKIFILRRSEIEGFDISDLMSRVGYVHKLPEDAYFEMVEEDRYKGEVRVLVHSISFPEVPIGVCPEEVRERR